MRRNRSLLLMLMATVAMLSSCAENTVGPGSGSGTLLQASIRGTSTSFGLTTLLSTYDGSAAFTRFIGSASGAPSRTLNITFEYDLETGALPHTLSDPELQISLVEISGSDTTAYNCLPLAGCSSTLTISSKTSNDAAAGTFIIDGTFSATLVNAKDSTSKITITDGKFSVKLSKI